MNPIITAIDLGTHTTVCLAGEQTDKGIRLLACKQAPSRGISRGEVLNNQLALQTLRPLLRDLEAELGRAPDQVVVNISGMFVRCTAECNTLIRNNQQEEISREEIAQLQKSMLTTRPQSGERVLHALAQSYHIDQYMGITEPVGMFGQRIEANYKLVIGRQACVEGSLRCLKGAGLDQVEPVVAPLATALAVLQDNEKELGVVLVDIGAGTTDVLVCYDNVVRHCAVIPFGGNMVTEDIRQGCAVTLADAEVLKRKCGYCYVDTAPENTSVALPGIGGQERREIAIKTLSCIIEARMDEILDAVLYEVDRSGFRNKLKAGMVLTGGGAQLLHLQTFVKYKTGYDSRIAIPLHLDPDTPSEWRFLTHSCAVGLLCYGFDKLDQTALLRQAEEREAAQKAAEQAAREAEEKAAREAAALPSAVDLRGRKREKKSWSLNGMMDSFWGKTTDKHANQA